MMTTAIESNRLPVLAGDIRRFHAEVLESDQMEAHLTGEGVDLSAWRRVSLS